MTKAEFKALLLKQGIKVENDRICRHDLREARLVYEKAIPKEVKEWMTKGLIFNPVLNLRRGLKTYTKKQLALNQPGIFICSDNLKDYRGSSATGKSIFGFTKAKARMVVRNWEWIEKNEKYAWVIEPHLEDLRKFAGL